MSSSVDTTNNMTAHSAVTPLQFQPFSSAIDVSFWSALSAHKLDEYKLDTSPREIIAGYGNGRHVQVPSQLHFTSSSFPSPSSSSSSSPPVWSSSITAFAYGRLLNTNTIEDFKRLQPSVVMDAVREEMWKQWRAHITEAAGGASSASSATATPSALSPLLSRFHLLTFADLKNHRYWYWMCVPAFVIEGLSFNVPTHSPVQTLKDAWTDEQRRQLMQQYMQFASQRATTTAAGGSTASSTATDAFFLVVKSQSSVSIHSIDSYSSLASSSQQQQQQQVFFAFIDPSPVAHPGWPARQLLTYLWLRFGIAGEVMLLSFRDADVARTAAAAGAVGGSGSATVNSASMIFTVNISAAPTITPLSVLSSSTPPKCVGWERNTATGKSTPRCMDLGSLMSPLRLAEASVDLNLRLMRWRQLPQLDLPLLQRTRCLLLGAGTLGCNVARLLLAWGFRHITLVDNGKVSYSNPVRQSLFFLNDCEGGGKPKAPTAAEALKLVFPGVHATGIEMTIPMPGHAVPTGETEKVLSDISQLEQLVDSHDVVFQLTDSRESRWLPTLLSAAKNKMCLNTALGFDTYLVMRHGDNHQPSTATATTATAASASSSSAASSSSSVDAMDDVGDGVSSMSVAATARPKRVENLGCYFCNDVVAPTDSLSDRTLDQQCTVTRPGLAYMSSALAVELCVSLLHHPLRQHAAAEIQLDTSHGSETAAAATEEEAAHAHSFGVLPHQLRGFLRRYVTLSVVGEANANCTACSTAIIQAYQSQGAQFILQALNQPTSFLEDISGLTKLKRDAELAMEAMSVDSEEDIGDDF